MQPFAVKLTLEINILLQCTQGDQRLRDDFGTAFKRLTELGFEASANEEAAYYTPRNWRSGS